MRRGFAILGISFLLAGCVQPTSNYVNLEYEYRLNIPRGFRVCNRANSQYDGTEHGIEILLDPADGVACTADDLFKRHRMISTWAGYNVFDDTATLAAYVAHECENFLGGSCQAGPEGLQIDDLKSVALRADHKDCEIIIAVMALAGTDPDVDYDVTLCTDTAHLDQDLPVLRTMLATLRVPHPRAS